MTYPTDFRALLDEVADMAEKHVSPYLGHQEAWSQFLDKIDAALSAAPQQPSDDELLSDVAEFADEAIMSRPEDRKEFANALRGMITRYGGQAAPVPVAERLPQESDLRDGRCWYGAPDRPGAIACWDFDREPADDDTHWLPHYALPLPEAQP